MASLDYWRKLFRSTNSDIFQVIDNAITVAAVDRADEFLTRRDQIAEKLFTCRLDRCHGCDRSQRPPDREEEEGELGEGVRKSLGPLVSSNCSYDEAEALTEEIEEERQIVDEVLRIKRILQNHQDESAEVIFDSLRRLQLMALSVENLKATEIGRAVNRLRKHRSQQISQLARGLIDGWKLLVDEWVNTAPAAIPVEDNSPDSVNPSVLDEEEGLPSPPLEEGALFSTQTIQISEFFDGMDDDGNIKSEGVKMHESGKRPLEKQPPVRFSASEPEERTRQEKASRQIKPKHSVAPNDHAKPQVIIKCKSNSESGPGSPARLPMNFTAPHDKMTNSEDSSVRAKLEVAKRKLQERYQQADNAKKQRTIQVVELHDLPKQGHQNNNRMLSNAKHKSSISNWASKRHQGS